MSNISLQNLSFSFPIFTNHGRSFKNSLINHMLGGRIENKSGAFSSVTALNQISFDLMEGDRLGILGHNGSGKTTLLRVIAGVYKNYAGRLIVNGSISSLIDISLGMDQEATGYENIRMRGILMGISLKKLKEMESEIAAFSELGRFLDLPIRTYSSGMLMRLGFAISTAIKSDILIMDEWLSVGDEDFKQKAEERLRDLISNKTILILASHSKELIESVCNKTLTLSQGNLVYE